MVSKKLLRMTSYFVGGAIGIILILALGSALVKYMFENVWLDERVLVEFYNETDEDIDSIKYSICSNTTMYYPDSINERGAWAQVVAEFPEESYPCPVIITIYSGNSYNTYNMKEVDRDGSIIRYYHITKDLIREDAEYW